MPKKTKESVQEPNPVMDKIMRDYQRGQQDMEKRKDRKNGWNDTIKIVMDVVPTPWPFQAKVTEPLLWTTILEKTGRLLNSKLKGRLVPRPGKQGNLMKARINNALLDLQWDLADSGGTMLEKIASCDQIARLMANAYGWIYWDNYKDSNEFKVVDPRDVLLDPRLDSIKSACGNNWVIIREWTSREALKEQGYDIPVFEDENPDQKSVIYDNVIKAIRGTEEMDATDENNVLEVCHHMTVKETITFLPRHKIVLKTKPNKRKKIQVAMLRYYSVPGDILGRSEVEPVLPLARTVNWTLSGYVEEGNKMMHPPIITTRSGAELPTIVHTPGAVWIENQPNMIRQFPMGRGIIDAFSAIYPMLKAAIGTAMGSQSMGISQVEGGRQDDKTKFEVQKNLEQQSTRDQYNQLFLGEFLKDIMMMWQANNKEYLLDDPTKATYVMKLIGSDAMKEFKQMGLHEMDVPGEAMNEITDMVSQNPSQYSDQQLQGMIDQVKQPKYPVVTNPEASPEMYNVVPKLDVKDNGEEADLHIEREDLEGIYDFIPDIVSMSAGANIEQKKERREALALLTTQDARNNLAASGIQLNAKELYSKLLADSKYDNPDNFFESIPNPATAPGMPGAIATPGIGGLQAPVPMGGGQAIPMGGARPPQNQING